MNDRWCNTRHITVEEEICCKNIELLAISMRPYYILTEFLHVTEEAVHIPLSACAVTLGRKQAANTALIGLRKEGL